MTTSAAAVHNAQVMSITHITTVGVLGLAPSTGFE